MRGWTSRSSCARWRMSSSWRIAAAAAAAGAGAGGLSFDCCVSDQCALMNWIVLLQVIESTNCS